MKILNKILGGIFPTNVRLTIDDNQVDNEIQNVIRGAGLTPEAEVSLTGTSSSVGTAVTGVGTLFLTELRVGDLFYKDSAQNDVRRITNITSDLVLTVESAFASDFSAQACSIFNVTQLKEAIPLIIPDASQIVKGIAEIATQTEIETGTDDTRIVSPKGLRDATKPWQEVTSVTALNQATVELIWANDSKYSNYELIGDGILPVTNDVYLYMRVSTDGGSTWKSGASDYEYGGTGIASNGLALAISSVADTKISFVTSTGGNQMSNVSGENVRLEVKFSNPDNSTYKQQFTWKIVYTNTAGAEIVYLSGGCRYNANTAINGLQLYMSSGNVSVGDFKLNRY